MTPKRTYLERVRRGVEVRMTLDACALTDFAPQNRAALLYRVHAVGIVVSEGLATDAGRVPAASWLLASPSTAVS